MELKISRAIIQLEVIRYIAFYNSSPFQGITISMKYITRMNFYYYYYYSQWNLTIERNMTVLIQEINGYVIILEMGEIGNIRPNEGCLMNEMDGWFKLMKKQRSGTRTAEDARTYRYENMVFIYKMFSTWENLSSE